MPLRCLKRAGGWCDPAAAAAVSAFRVAGESRRGGAPYRAAERPAAHSAGNLGGNAESSVPWGWRILFL